VPFVGPLTGGALGAAVYNVVFTGKSDIFLIVTIAATVLVLLLGVFLNKSVLKEDTSKLM